MNSPQSHPPRVLTAEELFLKTLRESTRDVHDRLEATPVARALMNADLTREGYRLWLSANLGIIEPFEERLQRHMIWRVLGLDPCERLKVPALEADLRELGVDPGDLARAPGLPAFDHDAEVIGAMYVLEGATLGGQVIARQLAHHFGFGPENGARFFHVYGEDVGPRWREFKEAMARYAIERQAADTIISGARKTFLAFEAWYDQAFRHASVTA